MGLTIRCSQRLCLSHFALTHELRQARSWLSFNVRQKMKYTIHYVILLCATLSLAASPLEVFRAEMNKEYTEDLPGFWVTWDSDSKEARKLWDDNFDKFLSIRKLKAKEHTAFLRRITGNNKIECDDQGYRADRQDIDSITITPKKWVLAISDDRSSDTRGWLRWSRVVGFKTRDHTIQAILDFKQATQKFHLENPSPATKNLIEEINQTFDIINRLLDDSNTVKVDDQRRLSAFIQKWIK